MILGILFLLGGGALILFGWRQIAGARSGAWVTAEGTRILVTTAPGAEVPRLSLESRGATLFGPVPAAWDPPRGMAAVPAPVTGSAAYRVGALVDLSGEDALGTGDPRLAKMLRGAFGGTALVLAPEAGDRPVLLQGLSAVADGSAGGIGIGQTRLEGLLGLVGKPEGLRVEVVRRRLVRRGWGPQQARRHRARD